MRTPIGIIALVSVAVAGSSACATKGYVAKSVGAVNDKVEAISQSLGETQRRTQANTGEIENVGGTARAAQRTAEQAVQSAGAADAKATAAGARTDEIDRASKRLLYTVVLSEDEGKFEFGDTALPADAKARIDELVARLKADPQGAYFEIEGHTDATGPREFNARLGLERAESVKRYLYAQHQIPLHRINTISCGAEKPVAPNTTKTGRAQNRRVVVRVLA
jgi:peptidoglycan-associated lipoprotein